MGESGVRIPTSKAWAARLASYKWPDTRELYPFNCRHEIFTSTEYKTEIKGTYTGGNEMLTLTRIADAVWGYRDKMDDVQACPCLEFSTKDARRLVDLCLSEEAGVVKTIMGCSVSYSNELMPGSIRVFEGDD